MLGHNIAIFYLGLFKESEDFLRLGLHFLIRFALISVTAFDVKVERDEVRWFLNFSLSLYI